MNMHGRPILSIIVPTKNRAQYTGPCARSLMRISAPDIEVVVQDNSDNDDLKRMVKPGVYILISTPNITSWYSRLNFLLKGRFHQFEDHDRDYGHINPTAQDELLYIAKNLDLNTVKASPGGFLPRLWLLPSFKGMILNVIGFLSSFFMRGIKNGWCLISLFRKD